MAELADFDHGGDRSKGPNGPLKLSEAAQALKVGERTVKRAKEVKDSATPEVVVAARRATPNEVDANIKAAFRQLGEGFEGAGRGGESGPEIGQTLPISPPATGYGP